MVRFSMMAALLLLCSCSSLYVNGLDYNQGRRRGKVLAIDRETEGRSPVTLNCRKSSADASHAAHTLYVQYDFTRRQAKYFATVRSNFPKFAVVQMLNEVSVKQGDWVFLNIHDCRVTLDGPHSSVPAEPA